MVNSQACMVLLNSSPSLLTSMERNSINTLLPFSETLFPIWKGLNSTHVHKILWATSYNNGTITEIHHHLAVALDLKTTNKQISSFGQKQHKASRMLFHLFDNCYHNNRPILSDSPIFSRCASKWRVGGGVTYIFSDNQVVFHRLRIFSDDPGQSCQLWAVLAAQIIRGKFTIIQLEWVLGHTGIHGNE